MLLESNSVNFSLMYSEHRLWSVYDVSNIVVCTDL